MIRENLSQDFILAAANGNLDRVQELLSQNLVDVNVVNQFGQTALIEVCKSRLNEALNPGFRPESNTANAFMVADYLLKNGANPALVENNGYGAIHQATMHGYSDLVGLILDKDSELLNSKVGQWTPVFLAVYHNRFEVVRTLILKGADLEEKMKIDDKEFSLTDFTRHITDSEDRENMLHLINSQRTDFAVRNASAQPVMSKSEAQSRDS